MAAIGKKLYEHLHHFLLLEIVRAMMAHRANAMTHEGGEGIISKKAAAPYSGRRSRNWLQLVKFCVVGASGYGRFIPRTGPSIFAPAGAETFFGFDRQAELCLRRRNFRKTGWKRASSGCRWSA